MLDGHDPRLIPSSYSRIIARELGLAERDLPRLLRGTGLSVDILLPGDETPINGEQQLQIIDNALGLSRFEEFGLRLGRQLQPGAFGPLGYLALSSPDLLTSLNSLRDFLPTRLPFVRLEVREERRWLSCSATYRLPAGPGQQRAIQECFAMVIQSFAETVLGRELPEARIDVAHGRPAYHGVYSDYLHAPVRFLREVNVYALPVGLAREANASGDPEAYALAQDLCRRLMDQVPGSVLNTGDRVRRMLLSSTPGSITEVDVARAMFISKRTLARRLAAEGSSYRGIREELLADLAARHLRESGLTVDAVAALLGYNDTAAFRKAFRRWYGKAPGEFRGC